MADQRKLARKGQPGDVYPESCWIKARQWLEGVSETAAKTWVEAEISAGRVIVINPEG